MFDLYNPPFPQLFYCSILETFPESFCCMSAINPSHTIFLSGFGNIKKLSANLSINELLAALSFPTMAHRASPRTSLFLNFNFSSFSWTSSPSSSAEAWWQYLDVFHLFTFQGIPEISKTPHHPQLYFLFLCFHMLAFAEPLKIKFIWLKVRAFKWQTPV